MVNDPILYRKQLQHQRRQHESLCVALVAGATVHSRGQKLCTGYQWNGSYFAVPRGSEVLRGKSVNLEYPGHGSVMQKFQLV